MHGNLWFGCRNIFNLKTNPIRELRITLKKQKIIPCCTMISAPWISGRKAESR